MKKIVLKTFVPDDSNEQGFVLKYGVASVQETVASFGMGVDVCKPMVILGWFDRHLSHVTRTTLPAMTPSTARDLARALMEAADGCSRSEADSSQDLVNTEPRRG